MTHEMRKKYKAERSPFREIIPLWQPVFLFLESHEENKEDVANESQHTHFYKGCD